LGKKFIDESKALSIIQVIKECLKKHVRPDKNASEKNYNNVLGLVYNANKNSNIPADVEAYFQALDGKSLLQIGIAAKQYYDYEVGRLGYKIKDPNAAFIAFLNNNPIATIPNTDTKTFQWSKFVVLPKAATPPPAAPEVVTSSYRFDDVYQRALLGESPDNRTPEDVNARKVQTRVATSNAASKSSGFNAFSKTATPTNETSMPPENGYTIGNLITDATENKVPSAKTLYDMLIRLAGYVKTNQKGDWKEVAGGLGQVAQGISSMGPKSSGPLI